VAAELAPQLLRAVADEERSDDAAQRGGAEIHAGPPEDR
jgi:hypothetical protein